MIKTIFRTLRYRNFRLFFAGQSVSLVGTWIQYVAMGWLVYRLTHSAFILGVVGFSSQIPTFLLSPFAGVLADRLNRRRVLVFTQTLSMVQALILAVLTLTGAITVWQIIALGIFLGSINALDIPFRQAFLVEMVEGRENLGNAIPLNSLIFNAARFIGPSIAGILVAIVGEGPCFLINAISFLAVIVSLRAMDIKPPAFPAGHSHIIHGLKEGFTYAFSFMSIRVVLTLLSVISLTGMSYVVLMPVFAKDILKGGPNTFGFLMASVGIGALAATVYLASRKTITGLGNRIPLFSSIFALGIISFSLSRTLWLSLIMLGIAGFGVMAHMAASNTILQTIVDDDKRGRVMSFYTMAFMGMAPLGSILAGSFAEKIGATNTLIIGGVVSIFASLAFAAKIPLLRKAVHPECVFY